MRAFVRHPVELPIEVRGESGPAHTEQMYNIGLGGLACHTDTSLETGTRVHVRIPSLVPEFSAEGEVAWARRQGDHYLVGIRFEDEEDAFRARMVEQVCHIHQYRMDALQQGRALSCDEAAREWVARHAADFPDL